MFKIASILIVAREVRHPSTGGERLDVLPYLVSLCFRGFEVDEFLRSLVVC
uniref:Predicted protein n=1 Tax=Hordeum vulgare subsp. vulgare TaxID=112509 RepID=F2E5H8_HORVV|nr:predicted protein [Hordeum vulgare subsp. vulgare]